MNWLGENKSTVQAHASKTLDSLSALVSTIQRSRNSLQRLLRNLRKHQLKGGLGVPPSLAVLPRDSTALFSKWVQCDVCRKVMEGSAKPLQDKARSSLNCHWRLPINSSLSFLHSSVFLLLSPLTSFQEGGSVISHSFWDEKQQHQVGFPFCKIMQEQNG